MENDWNFLNDKVLHKCGKLVVRPKAWERYPLYCSRCNIRMPDYLQNVAEFLYEETSFHDPYIFYFTPTLILNK